MDANIVINMDWLKSADLKDLKEALRMGGRILNEVNALLQTPEGKEIASEMLNDPDYIPVSKRQPTSEEAAEIEADRLRAEQQAAEAVETTRLETEQKAAKEAEDKAAAEAEAARKAAPVKKVLEYQVTDEATGKPIGRPTHIEYTTEEELVEKMKAAHVNAVRYADRIKRGRVQSIETNAQHETIQTKIQKDREDVAKEIELAAKENDPQKLTEAIRKVSRVERDAEKAEQDIAKEGRELAQRWMNDHKDDYVQCVANSKLIEAWLNANGPIVDGVATPLKFTYDNLELAFAAVESQLVKPEKQAPIEEVPAVVANNPPAAAPVASAPAPPPIPASAAPAAATSIAPAVQPSTPVTAAPEPTSVAAPNAQPATRRPGVNGSLPPGALSAQRPQAGEQPQASTRAELMKELRNMPGPEMRRKLKDANYVKKLEAAGIPVLGLR